MNEKEKLPLPKNPEETENLKSAPAENPTPAEPTEPVEAVETTSAETPAPAKSTKKSSKAGLIITIVLAVIGIVAAVVFAVLYFTRPAENPSQPTPPPAANQPADAPSETPAENDNSTAEVEITDPYLLRSLNETIAYLHNTIPDSPELNASRVYVYFEPLNLYATGDISDQAKVYQLIRNAIPESAYRYIVREQVETIIKDLGYDGEAADYLRRYLTEGLDGDLVAQKYYEVFGATLNHQNIESCYAYRYSNDYGFYYQDPWGGCGGSSPYIRYYYQIKATADANNAYIYAAAALGNLETNEIYCGFPNNLSSPDATTVCETVSDLNNFTINASNYQKFPTYRFVFPKSADGTYHFARVEKV